MTANKNITSLPSHNEDGSDVSAHQKVQEGETCAIFGGTFDPIHYGHIALAEHIRTALGIEEVWFLVTPQNPWKRNNQLAPDDIRLEMVRAALQNHPHLIASDYEFHLEKPSYSYQTLRHLRHDFPDKKFTLIIGADNWVDFKKWSHPDEILENHSIAVFPRDGHPIDTTTLPSNVTFVDAPLLPISSTEIRRAIADGRGVKTLTTPDDTPIIAPAVADIIHREHLYER